MEEKSLPHVDGETLRLLDRLVLFGDCPFGSPEMKELTSPLLTKKKGKKITRRLEDTIQTVDRKRYPNLYKALLEIWNMVSYLHTGKLNARGQRWGTQAEIIRNIEKRIAIIRAEQAETQSAVLARPKRKSRNTGPNSNYTNNQLKIIAWLVKHHEYEMGKCTNLEPIRVNESATQLNISASSFTEFWKKAFNGSYKTYQQFCVRGDIEKSLEMLTGDLRPSILNREFRHN